jgi:FKBP-type peptidyl-prolyl cis-trans isomerase FkpA
MKLIFQILCIFLSFTALNACGKKKQPPIIINMDQKFKDPLVDKNKEMSHEEKRMIDSYVKRNKFDMIETGTGVRYMIYEKGKGPSADTKDIVLIDFDIKLLDGTVCYTSRETGAEEFVVDYDNVESGLHEAIKYLHKGDKAIIIIPSHRAFGLAGDMERIPPFSTLVYNIHLLDIIKRK